MNKTKVRMLGEARNILAVLKEEMADRTREFEDENGALIHHVAYAEEWVKELTEDCKGERVAEFDGEDKGKEDFYGFGIQERKRLSYDEGVAFEWAFEHKLALNLDKKKFEAMAGDGSLAFVLVSYDVTATAPGDLDKWLK